jgi:SAM-dependent methyltransferase
LPSCPFCFSSEVLETLQVKEMTKGTRRVFHYAICENCRSAYIKDFPENISQYYEGYYSFGDGTLTLDKSVWKRTIVSAYSKLVVRAGLSFLLRPLFRCPPPWHMNVLSPNLQAFMFIGAGSNARILDVGCGVGQFLDMMNRFGYERTTGIDPFLGDNLQRPHIRRSDIHSVNGTHDVILFNHTLEHMTDPEAALKKCASLLSPKGMVLIHIPNIHSREFATYKQHWCWMHAPYHFAIPSRYGIELLADRCGFKVVDTICTSRADHYLYSDEYSRDIGDRDSTSARRELEDGTFDQKRYSSLAKVAFSLNKALSGDWIAYYLVRN